MINALSPLNMISIRNDERCIRKYTLNNGVLVCSCYIENKCYLRLNLLIESGEFNLIESHINLSDFRDEITIALSVCEELLNSNSH